MIASENVLETEAPSSFRMTNSFLNKKVLKSTFFYVCLLLPFLTSITVPETVYASNTLVECPDTSYRKTTSNVKTALVSAKIMGGNRITRFEDLEE